MNSKEEVLRDQIHNYLKTIVKRNDMELFRAGIYFLLNDDGNPVYIGKAKCLMRRLSKHYTDKRIIFNSFRYMRIDGDLYDYEMAFIKIFNPEYNIKGANGLGLTWALKKAESLLLI